MKIRILLRFRNQKYPYKKSIIVLSILVSIIIGAYSGFSSLMENEMGEISADFGPHYSIFDMDLQEVNSIQSGRIIQEYDYLLDSFSPIIHTSVNTSHDGLSFNRTYIKGLDFNYFQTINYWYNIEYAESITKNNLPSNWVILSEYTADINNVSNGEDFNLEILGSNTNITQIESFHVIGIIKNFTNNLERVLKFPGMFGTYEFIQKGSISLTFRPSAQINFMIGNFSKFTDLFGSLSSTSYSFHFNFKFDANLNTLDMQKSNIDRFQQVLEMNLNPLKNHYIKADFYDFLEKTIINRNVLINNMLEVSIPLILIAAIIVGIDFLNQRKNSIAIEELKQYLGFSRLNNTAEILINAFISLIIIFILSIIFSFITTGISGFFLVQILILPRILPVNDILWIALLIFCYLVSLEFFVLFIRNSSLKKNRKLSLFINLLLFLFIILSIILPLTRNFQQNSEIIFINSFKTTILFSSIFLSAFIIPVGYNIFGLLFQESRNFQFSNKLGKWISEKLNLRYLKYKISYFRENYNNFYISIITIAFISSFFYNSILISTNLQYFLNFAQTFDFAGEYRIENDIDLTLENSIPLEISDNFQQNLRNITEIELFSPNFHNYESVFIYVIDPSEWEDLRENSDTSYYWNIIQSLQNSDSDVIASEKLFHDIELQEKDTLDLTVTDNKTVTFNMGEHLNLFPGINIVNSYSIIMSYSQFSEIKTDIMRFTQVLIFHDCSPQLEEYLEKIARENIQNYSFTFISFQDIVNNSFNPLLSISNFFIRLKIQYLIGIYSVTFLFVLFFIDLRIVIEKNKRVYRKFVQKGFSLKIIQKFDLFAFSSSILLGLILGLLGILVFYSQYVIQQKSSFYYLNSLNLTFFNFPWQIFGICFVSLAFLIFLVIYLMIKFNISKKIFKNGD
ncbi:MAG: hypothetical protein K9W44_04075 [Candidatus Lokiarchaeota archaeon]|nr:hypothetical protein [Candidatus Harpocratesius repetitus]